MPYLCPQCDAVYPRWGNLKGHMLHNHKAEQLKEATEEQFKDYAITDEEAKERKRKKILGDAAAITEIPTEPVERLETVLKVNKVDPEVTETVVNIFRLNPRWWGDPYQLDDLLRPRVKPAGIVVSLVKQYIDEVEITKELAQRYGIPRRSASTYHPGGEGGRGSEEYPGSSRERGSEPVTRADLLEEREHQRQEREQNETRRRLAEVEAKLHPTTESAPESKTMTIADEKGNPMIIPYDPMLMDAIRREQEARARKAEREEMLSQMTALTGGGRQGQESLKEIMEAVVKPLQDQITKAQEEAVKTREELRKKELGDLEKRTQKAEQVAEEAREIAAGAARGDKTMLDYAGEAGTEMRDAMDKAAKDVKSGLQDAGDRISSILTGRTPAKQQTSRSPAEIAAIMEAEERVLKSLGKAGKGAG